MKVVVFNIYLCFLVLCGGCAIYAAHHHHQVNYTSARDHAKRQHVKLTNSDLGNTILEDAEIDLDEDYLKGHGAEDTDTHQLSIEKYNLLNKWYVAFTASCITNHYHKQFTTSTPFYGDSSPIYITQRVLRI